MQGNKFTISDEFWAKIEPVLPAVGSKPHPLGCHRGRVPNRRVMNSIFFVLRNGCQWKALDATGIVSGSTAHRRFQEWVRAGVFHAPWTFSLEKYDEVKGIDWQWLAMDGAKTKNASTVGGKGSGPNPTDRAKQGVKRSLLTDAAGIPLGVAVAGAS